MRHTISKVTRKAAREAVEGRIVTIPNDVWRSDALNHDKRIRTLLGAGLMTSKDHSIDSKKHKKKQHQKDDGWTALDPKNPVYNFLIEYYGIKGAKGPRRLARWSPDPSLIFHQQTPSIPFEELLNELRTNLGHEKNDNGNNVLLERLQKGGGILLEDAIPDDIGSTLHLRGATYIENVGILYSPALHFTQQPQQNNNTRTTSTNSASSSYRWYQSILSNTIQSTPILHCYGLHEWAMQYQPPNAPPPPSAKYQSHLPLRVSQQTINTLVERKGISCTHVDALRYFAPAAKPLNQYGGNLDRADQLNLEQKGCVHATMDLFKISLRLQPFVDASLIGDALEVALLARRLDVEASPYDATAYGLGVVYVETNEGRAEYKRRQVEVMEKAEVVRKKLLSAYDDFLMLALFDE
uniref:Uncharacterized protein n=1 Tax=Ditylum brightwellii TaxID=49249 RepID=A0A6V2QB80_9STRA